MKQPKFKTGDIVWTIDCFKAVQGTIVSIIAKNPRVETVEYRGESDRKIVVVDEFYYQVYLLDTPKIIYFEELRLFKSKSVLKKSL